MSFREVFDPRRCKGLNNHKYQSGNIVYWMSRDQRVEDNWALGYALAAAQKHNVGLAVVFNLITEFPRASQRSFEFMVEGLRQVEAALSKQQIPFYLLIGDPVENITKFVDEQSVGLVVTDFSPLRGGMNWRCKVAEKLTIPIHMIDAHNIVPVWVASDKQEYAARTIRPKINKILDEWLIDIPRLPKSKNNWEGKIKNMDWEAAVAKISVAKVPELTKVIEPGSQAAHQQLHKFINQVLDKYADEKNFPEKQSLSHLSPYLHFGQIAPQRVAWEVKHSVADQESVDSYLEELIIRRELSDNFCYYNRKYDQLDSFADWAKKTLNEHRDDKREYIYSFEDLEAASTHDDLWNAAQLEMVYSGKMHGYMRMYWGKKILEWTESPEQALEFAIRLNDKYELDGRDPNGYVGIAWSIGGVHDRAWFEREIFGKIRYMSRSSTGKKFDSDSYIKYAESLVPNP